MLSRLSILTVFAFVALWALPPSGAGAQKKALTLEAIFDGSLSVPGPSQMQWVSDDRLSYLMETESSATADEEVAEENGSEGDGSEEAAEGDSTAEDSAEDSADDGGGRDLWVLDVVTGEKQILVTAAELREMAPTPSQAGVDERERTRRSRFNVNAYHFSPDEQQVLFTSSGQLLLYQLADQKAKILAPSKHGVLDPKFSPDGQWIAFVYEHDIWVVPVVGGAERRLTRGGHELLLHGDLDWVYPEELGVRTGYHFSPDSRHIAFLEMDESSVPTYPITEQLAWQATVDLQRYPKPGDPNPRVRVGIVSVEKARTVWLDRAAEYIPRIDWADAEHVAVQLLNRGQNELELVLADPASGRSRSVMFERDEHWVGVTKDLSFLEDGKHFLWTSERSGLRQIYLYDRAGQSVRQLTDGEFQVGAIAGVDEAGGWVYYSANEDNLLGLDLYRVRLDGSGKERISREKGTHRIDMSPSATAWVDGFSALDPYQVRHQTAHHQASGRKTEIHRDFDLADYDLVQPQIEELRAPDGALVRVMVMKPSKIKRGKKHPMLIYVYGMAGFPTIRDTARRSRFLFHQFLVQQGYVVAYVDDRSSSIPGHKYATAAYRDVGPVAAADAGVAVEYFRSLTYVDAERLAIWGWSGGGFTTCFQMGHTDYYKVGIAGAPVTDWRLYDSIYTERYMGLPDDDPEAYDRTSALQGAADVEGRLLLIHGTHDDNVHPQNTLKMMNELIENRKQFDLMLYPNKTHGISGTDHNVHLYTMIYEYLERHL